MLHRCLFSRSPAPVSRAILRHLSCVPTPPPVSLTLSGGRRVETSGLWLRDHCHCPQCRHTVTKQRILITSTIPLDIRPTHIEAKGGATRLTWPDGHISSYDTAWLENALTDPTYNLVERPSRRIEPVLWNAKEMDTLRPTVTYDEVMNSDEGLLKWLKNIATYGIGLVEGVPTDVEHNQKLAERIAPIRETHYGGFTVVEADLDHGDTAYTQLALPLHTDTTYFTDPIGLQIFHILHRKGTGGESIFLDGFRAAQLLRERDPEAWEVLTQHPVPAAARGDVDVDVRATPLANPILRLHPATGALYQIRYNNDDRITLPHTSPSAIHQFYRSLRAWKEILDTPEEQWHIQLEPGTVAIFDNWRVLHSRSAFSGERVLGGAYLGADDWKSRLRVLQDHLEKN